MRVTVLTDSDALEYLRNLRSRIDDVDTDDVDYVLVAKRPLTSDEEWRISMLAAQLAVFAMRCYETSEEIVYVTYHA